MKPLNNALKLPPCLVKQLRLNMAAYIVINKMAAVAFMRGDIIPSMLLARIADGLRVGSRHTVKRFTLGLSLLEPNQNHRRN